ncbi:MAG: hypothetical protein ACW99F_14025 [Candidatus Hodarchaeales archaeon]|jgi:hypothetical protein
MDNSKSNNDPPPTFQDFITFKPQSIHFLTVEETELIHTYSTIISALRIQPMTAKDLFKHYKSVEDEKTMKTVYRHLEKLESAKLVVNAGQRVNRGNRVTEKLYARAANIFLSGTVETEELAKEKEGHAQIVSMLLNGYFVLPENSAFPVNEIITQFIDSQLSLLSEIYQTANKNDIIAEYFAANDLNTIHHLCNLAASISTFIKNPKLLTDLKKLIK